MIERAKYYLQISTSSGVPIYRQVIDQIKTHVATGQLEEGLFLPSVRQVSKELEINPMTVSKAYSLLVKEGVLESVRGQGMRVAKSTRQRRAFQNRTEQIIPLLNEVVTRTYQLSLDPKKVMDMLKDLWRENKDG